MLKQEKNILISDEQKEYLAKAVNSLDFDFSKSIQYNSDLSFSTNMIYPTIAYYIINLNIAIDKQKIKRNDKICMERWNR